MYWSPELTSNRFAWHPVKNGLILVLGSLIMFPTPIYSMFYVYDPSLGMKEPCQRRCELHRSGWTEKFSFDCNKLFDNTTMRKECEDDCKRCPKKVCDSKMGPIFKCPAVSLDDGTSKLITKPSKKFAPHIILAAAIPIIMAIAILIALICAYWLYLSRSRVRKLREASSQRRTEMMEAQNEDENENEIEVKEFASDTSMLDIDTFDDNTVHDKIFSFA